MAPVFYCGAPFFSQPQAAEFHYETAAASLYWFGTQFTLACRSRIDLLAK
jgi:hypothetical protein